jgi:hypothetical protein
MEKRIQSIDHNIGDFVRVRVGVGEIVDGKFEFAVPQQFETYFITDTPERVNPMTNELIKAAVTDYTDLVQMGQGDVKIENVLTIIDRIKARS